MRNLYIQASAYVSGNCINLILNDILGLDVSVSAHIGFSNHSFLNIAVQLNRSVPDVSYDAAICCRDYSGC